MGCDQNIWLDFLKQGLDRSAHLDRSVADSAIFDVSGEATCDVRRATCYVLVGLNAPKIIREAHLLEDG